MCVDSAVPGSFMVNILVHSLDAKFREGIVMRNFYIVQQPLNLTRFKYRLKRDTHNYISHRHIDGQPFLLIVPWVQVHIAMHVSEMFAVTAFMVAVAMRLKRWTGALDRF